MTDREEAIEEALYHVRALALYAFNATELEDDARISASWVLARTEAVSIALDKALGEISKLREKANRFVGMAVMPSSFTDEDVRIYREAREDLLASVRDGEAKK